MVDFKEIELLEKLAEEGEVNAYLPKKMKKGGNFAERKAAGIRRSTVDYTEEQRRDIEEIANYLRVPVQAVVKLAVHEFVVKHKLAFKKEA